MSWTSKLQSAGAGNGKKETWKYLKIMINKHYLTIGYQQSARDERGEEMDIIRLDTCLPRNNSLSGVQCMQMKLSFSQVQCPRELDVKTGDNTALLM